MAPIANAQVQVDGIDQYCSMHKTIIEQQGRITLEFLLQRRHFFGVGAFERRKGEISIFDSKAVVTSLAVMACPLSSMTSLFFVAGSTVRWRAGNGITGSHAE